MNEEQPRRFLDWRDVAGLVGVSLITGGVAMIHVPTAFIVCGTLMLTGAILSSRRG